MAEKFNSWENILNNIYKKGYFKTLLSFVNEEYKTKIIYLPKDEIFNAFNLCDYKNIKVVILGQDPYPNEGQANGLCFSVKNGVTIPASLRNIFKEIKREYKTVDSNDGDLSRWAKQGVLLLNTTLTVEKNKRGSHMNKGWEMFTNDIVSSINKTKNNIVYLLWGKRAGSFKRLINNERNLVLTSSHPSPLSARKGFMGCNHFILCNEYLKQHNIGEILWK